MHALASAANAKSIALLPAAEPQNAYPAVDAWNLELMREYNASGKAVVYNTYQSYLRTTPSTLAAHLRQAQREGFTLGAKLVRGAYLRSEERELIWDTKEETDQTFDALTSALLHRRFDGPLSVSEKKGEGPLHAKPSNQGECFPRVAVMLATHNIDSVRMAMRLREEQVERGEDLTDLTYSQLQGMADEVSCEIVQSSRAPAAEDSSKVSKTNMAPVYKAVTWGPVAECMHYLLRRVDETADAVLRTGNTRRAMRNELKRRIRGWLGLRR